MIEFINDFQTVQKQTPNSFQEDFNISIKDYNSITIINNTISNIVCWDNIENYILPNGVVNIKGDENQFLEGFLKIILFEQVIGFPEPKVVLIKKRYGNTAV
jgi:hypothetical protein